MSSTTYHSFAGNKTKISARTMPYAEQVFVAIEARSFDGAIELHLLLSREQALDLHKEIGAAVLFEHDCCEGKPILST